MDVFYKFEYKSEDLLIETLGEAPPHLQEATWKFYLNYPFTHPLLSQHLAIVDDDDEG